jgi:hypothetical protein
MPGRLWTRAAVGAGMGLAVSFALGFVISAFRYETVMFLFVVVGAVIAALRPLVSTVTLTVGIVAPAVAFTIIYTWASTGQGSCDGNVPSWLAERADGGCVDIPMLWEYFWPPDHWNAPDVCIGFCGS